MNRLAIVVAAALVASAGLVGSIALSQETRSGPGMMQGQHEMPGMMGSMMQGCPMMGRATASARGAELIPQLPPGNEKLQAQMTAEIMQKVGEIASKYAAQAK